jgi:RND family efflux transporter MFP subunit
MNDSYSRPSASEAAPPRPLLPRPGGDAPEPAPGAPAGRGSAGPRLLGLCLLALLIGALAFGVRRHYQQYRQVMHTAQQQANFVPEVRVETIRQRLGRMHVDLPGTTLAFEQANIYARASGYVARRFVDIGDHVKAGQLLAEITAPEVDDQIVQYRNSLQQAHETHDQTAAQQSLARATWGRDSVLVNEGWVTQQQGDTDRYGLQAQEHATQAAHFNAATTQAQLEYYHQQKIYQRVVAPFDGVITQRNIDVGSLIAADATSGTAMFAMVQSGVIRVWVYVPQDDAFGVKPGIAAVVRVPSMPNLTFRGKITRIADALQPSTRTLLTEVDVPNPNGALTPGVYCTVELKIPRLAPALIVPASAVIFNQNGMHVAVVDGNGIVHMHKITITTDFGTEVEVRGGVEEGDKVVLQPPVDLIDGDKVHGLPVKSAGPGTAR